MRLLMMSQDFPPHLGGIQTWTLELARRLARRCEAFHLVVPGVPGAETIDRDLDFPIHRVGRSTDALVATALARVAALTRTHRLDVALHAQWMTAPATLATQKFAWPKRTYVAAHGRELQLQLARGFPPVQAAYDQVRKHVVRHADGMIAVSRFTGQLLHGLGVPDSRIHVINNGTDPVFFSPRDARSFREELGISDRRVVLTTGRLLPHKGIDTVLRALPKVLRHFPDVVYLIAGVGPEHDRLVGICGELDLTDSVRFLGRVDSDRLPECYSACDIFVGASREQNQSVEGFGIVFVEAAACERPTIGTRSGGIADAIEDGVTGLLVDPLDPDELARALLRLLSDKATAERFGRAGRKRVLERFTWDVAADHIAQVLGG